MDGTGQDETDVKRVPMGAYVEPAMHKRLREVAREQDRSISSVVRRALDDYLNRAGGGPNPNLAPAHRSCNARKGAKPPPTVQAGWL
jgi:Antitoxin-like ribbon-helix-helix